MELHHLRFLGVPFLAPTATMTSPPYSAVVPAATFVVINVVVVDGWRVNQPWRSSLFAPFFDRE